MIGRLRQLSEPRLRRQAGIEKSQTPVERDILVQWVRIIILTSNILRCPLRFRTIVSARANKRLKVKEGQINGWLAIYVLFNSFSVVSG